MKARLGSSALGAMMIEAVAMVGCRTPDVVREKAAVPQPSATVAEVAAPGLVTPVAAQGTTPAAAQNAQNTAQEDGSSNQRSVYLGPIDEEQVFYLLTRGLSLRAAERIIVEGFFATVLDRIDDKAMHARLWDYVHGKLRTR